MAEEQTITRQPLPELCSGFLTYAIQVSKTSDPGLAEKLYLKVDELFRELDNGARANDIPLEDVQQAKYALVAFFDEIVLSSNWAAKDAWQGKPLQLAYFNDFSAGEEFFNKLEALRNTRDPRKLDVLEVYFLCLSLGFRGKYADLQGMERRKVLLDALAREMKTARGGDSGEELSPHWKPPDAMPNLTRVIPAWVVPVVCATLILILFIVLSGVLNGAVGGVQAKG
ncbi:MAG: DotU family type IV/VI secretion system protein [Planctomycetes bacterium]|nr:DotU family type IV/VI secretion system protein [Planctomycetota bacterium]